VAGSRQTGGVRHAEVRYAERDGDYLAFTVFGEGPTDLVIPQNRVPIDLIWEWPHLATFMEALGRLARVITWDGRGFGASDPVLDPTASTTEGFADDLRAVLRAADSERASLFDMGSGGAVSAAYPATYPERVQSLILVNLRRSYPELLGLSPSSRKRLAMRLRSPERLRFENPRAADDPVVQRWWGHAMRLANSPEQLATHLEGALVAGDLGPVHSTLRMPTLVLHRRGNRVWDIESSRAAASAIPNARFVELPGAENDIFLGDTAPVLAEIDRFLAEPGGGLESDRVLSTVLFTDMVASTQQLAARGDDAWRRTLDDHDQTMSRLVADHRGRVVKQLGDGILATFDGPARAVRCAAALLVAAQDQGITLRAGLHTGEIELRPADVTGIAVVIAQRISDLAAPNEIVVSRTVVDLTAGSGLQFEPRGDHELKGVPGTWSTFAASAGT
jgi:class 3 adenylate cyclase